MTTTFPDLFGNPVTSTSKEAVENFSKAVEAYVCTRGSCLDYLKRAVELDPNFTLAHGFLAVVYLECLLDSNCSEKLAASIAVLKRTEKSSVTEREWMHVEAVLTYSNGDMHKSCKKWMEILMKFAEDVYAVRLVFDFTLQLGWFEQMKGALASFMVHVPKSIPLYPYLLSLYGFALEETNCRDQAEEVCKNALFLQPLAGWATHTICHVIEEERDPATGIDFCLSSRQNWKECGLENHIVWHMTLFYLDIGRTDKVLEEFDEIFVPNLSPGNFFALMDASSLLWRMNVLGIDPGEERWRKVVDSFKPHLNNPILFSWVEVHLMMSLSYGKVNEDTARFALARGMIASMEKFADSSLTSDCEVAKMLGVPVCNALLAYGQERYDDVVSLLLPLRYDFIRFGGSFAQRQVFLVTLIQAAMKSCQWSQALAIISDLKARKPHNNLLKDLFEKVKKELGKEEVITTA